MHFHFLYWSTETHFSEEYFCQNKNTMHSKCEKGYANNKGPGPFHEGP